MPNGAGETLEAESLIFFVSEGALIAGAVDPPLGDVLARFVYFGPRIRNEPFPR